MVRHLQTLPADFVVKKKRVPRLAGMSNSTTGSRFPGQRRFGLQIEPARLEKVFPEPKKSQPKDMGVKKF